MVTLSQSQKGVLKKIVQWYTKEQKNQYITIGGYAGTGKTTLIAALRKQITKRKKDIKIGFVSYTGKASRVLLAKLKQFKALCDNDTVGTIHSLIYSPLINEKEEIIGWTQKDKIECDLIIIDEASMVDQVIWTHLLSYNIPIIVVGDHGQLPPISGAFHLIKTPQLELSEIHRQAQKSPIIALSIQARLHGYISPGAYGPTVRKFSKHDVDAQESVSDLLSHYSPDTLILCGYNQTRKRLNLHIRSTLGFTSPFPQSGDRVVCLRNNHKKQIYNGMTGTIITIKDISARWYDTEIEMDGEEKTYKGLVSKEQFMSNSALNFTHKRSAVMEGDLFDFGYALTVHKAQGSQATRVILFEERFSKMDDETWKRWLYTGVTRAEEELYIIET